MCVWAGGTHLAARAAVDLRCRLSTASPPLLVAALLSFSARRQAACGSSQAAAAAAQQREGMPLWRAELAEQAPDKGARRDRDTNSGDSHASAASRRPVRPPHRRVCRSRNAQGAASAQARARRRPHCPERRTSLGGSPRCREGGLPSRTYARFGTRDSPSPPAASSAVLKGLRRRTPAVPGPRQAEGRPGPLMRGTWAAHDCSAVLERR